MVREIVFDTETTGFNAEEGERLVEIGAVELINHIPTGKTYHQYINPEKEVPEEAYKVHGLSYDFLKDFPTFDKVADDWLEFIGEDSVLVAHNAQFDINFVNYELKQLGKPTLAWDRVVDTLEIARSMFPGARNNLDALCKRFGVDNSSRTNHGALLDAELLTKVYLELMGGEEPQTLHIKNKGQTVMMMCVWKTKRKPSRRSVLKIMKTRFTASRGLLPQQPKSWKLTRLFWKVRLKMPSGFPDFYLFRR